MPNDACHFSFKSDMCWTALYMHTGEIIYHSVVILGLGRSDGISIMGGAQIIVWKASKKAISGVFFEKFSAF